ncbi:MAG: sulfurtransferase [Bacilli bacterium]|nr:sulfurtransferase [Bacilli bacterium]
MNEPFIEPDAFNRMLLSQEINRKNVIDVREIGEWEYYHLAETTHIPMNSIPERLSEIPNDQTLYIICAHGVRSAAVCNYLYKHGYDQVKNVEGGMAAIAGLRGIDYD